MTLEQQVHQLEVRVRKLEQIEKDIKRKLQEQKEFEDKRDEAMGEIGHDM